jgi:hypothetical protein
MFLFSLTLILFVKGATFNAQPFYLLSHRLSEILLICWACNANTDALLHHLLCNKSMLYNFVCKMKLKEKLQVVK